MMRESTAEDKVRSTKTIPKTGRYECCSFLWSTARCALPCWFCAWVSAGAAQGSTSAQGLAGEKLPSRLPKLVSETGSENPAGSPRDTRVPGPGMARAINNHSRCENPENVLLLHKFTCVPTH